MYYFIIDTCVWIDLCKRYPELQEKIAYLVDQGKVNLILPQIVIEEWNRQKPRILDEKRQSFRGMIKNARTLSSYVPSNDIDKFKTILDNLQKQEQISEQLAKEYVENIEALFNHPSTRILEITNTAKIQAVDTALARKAPFGSKNSMADALIVISSVEYIRREGLDKCIFVSSNTRDFSSLSDPNELNDDLKEIFGESGLRYFTNIALAINEVEVDFISQEDVQEVSETINLVTIAEIARRTNEQIIQASGLIEAMQKMNEYVAQTSHVLEVAQRMREQIVYTSGIAEAAQKMHEQIAQTSEIADALKSISNQALQSSTMLDTVQKMSEQIIQTSAIAEAAKKMSEQIIQTSGIAEAARKMNEQVIQTSGIVEAARRMSEQIIQTSRMMEAARKINQKRSPISDSDLGEPSDISPDSE